MSAIDAGRPVFLVGFMGSGKSSVGRALAARLGWVFADTDSLVEFASGRTIETIFRESGEGRFRELEWEALRAFERVERVVVATGGGSFLGVLPRAFMKREGVTAWLDVPLEVAYARSASEQGRPLWKTDDPVAFRVFFERRRAVYALADVRVDASHGMPEDVAARLEHALRH